MKTFYIPTSTLNFNNILSIESISPKAFYEKRGFGYSRWTAIPENPFNNAIVLYDKLCHFERPISEVEDHSLLVEVLLDETELKQTENLWYSDHTIYFSPTTTKFLFFSENEKKITLSMSESSLETKLMRLYTNRITIVNTTEKYLPISINEPCSLNESEIDRDFRINKMKGLLYGYYIGALLSTDLNSIKYLNVLKEIHNIFAAILSSFDKQPTPYQNVRLDELFKIFNYKSLDYQQLFEIIGDVAKTEKVLNLDFVQPRDFARKKDFLFYLQAKQNDVEKNNTSIAWIKSKIEETKRSIMQNSQLLQPNKSEVVLVDNNVSMLKNENISNEIEEKLCLAWFNETLSSKGTNGKISTYKAKLADDITDEAIKVLGNNWKESNIRTYLNALRHYVAGEQFNQNWDNGVLASIAAVTIAGDDWEKLLAFMQGKEMTDYRLAFAYYGELNGYANLTRDFTDLLYDQDKNYVWNVYVEFHSQLFGKGIITKSKTSILEQTPIMQSEKGILIEQKSKQDNSEIFHERIAVVNMQKTSEKNASTQADASKEFVQKLYSLKWWNNNNVKREQIINILNQFGPSEKFIGEVKKVSGVGQQKITDLKNLFNIRSDYNVVGDDDLFMSDRSLISLEIQRKYPLETKFILSLESLKNISNKALERLIDIFGYTATRERDKNEHLKFFSSMCINEGCGHKKDGTPVPNKGLFGLYTEEFDKKLKNEIDKSYREYRP